MNIQLEDYKKYGITLNWDIILYGLENNFLDYSFVEKYIFDKLENQSKILESEMNLLLDLIDNKKNHLTETLNIDLCKRLTIYSTKNREQEIISKHVFQYICLNNVLEKYNLSNNFNKLDYDGLYSELSQIWSDFNYDIELNEFCDTYWIENFKDLSEKENCCQWLYNLVKDYLLKLSKKYNWIFNH